jgi:hypothetical protein
MRCPLPIDWLEYLEGASSDELEAHLTECLPCRLLVEELRREARPQLQLSRLSRPDAWPHWRETEQTSVTFGEIRLAPGPSTATNTLGRVPVLVLSDTWEEKGNTWCEVVPLLTDIENATSLDIVLHRNDTDLEVPWRVPLRGQTIANVRALGAPIGCLIESGRKIVERALEGRAPQERYGTPIEGPDDARVRLPQQIDSIIRLLGRAYALSTDVESLQTQKPRVLSFDLRRLVVPRSQTRGLQLAAESTVKEEEYEWFVEIPSRGSLKGRIEYRYADDEILFVVENVVEIETGLHSPVQIILWSQRLSKPIISELFVPKIGDQVLLGRDLGVLPREVGRLEVRLSDED